MVEELEGLVEILGTSLSKAVGGNLMISILIILFVIMLGLAVKAGSENIVLFVIVTASLLAIGGILPSSMIGVLILIMAFFILQMLYDMFVSKR
jgi:hypothetical protein